MTIIITALQSSHREVNIFSECLKLARELKHHVVGKEFHALIKVMV